MINRRKFMVGTGAVAVTGAVAMAIEPNYQAAASRIWQPVVPTGDADLRYLAHYATRAANSHNTQPWRFALNDRQVTISPDLSRGTPAVDPDHHHLFASLGCAAENLSLAASAAGSAANIGFGENGEGQVTIDLEKSAPRNDPLFEAILHRQSTRSDYDARTVPAADLAAMEAAANAVKGARVVIVTERPRIEQILELVIAANTRQVEDPAFVAELKEWLRYNSAQAVREGDGLYSGCTGNPSVPPWLGQLMFGLFFTAKSENERYARQIMSSAGLAIFVSDSDDPAHWVSAGRAYQRFALAATLAGVRHAFINQPVEIADTRPQLASLLGIGDKRPDLMIRFGYAPPMPRSLRRPVDEVIG